MATDSRLRYLVTLSRPRFWLYLAGPALVGLVYGAGSTAELLTPGNAALFLYFLLPANVMLYGVNDFFDRRIDRLNAKKEGKESLFRQERYVTATVLAAKLCAVPVILVLPRAAVAPLLTFVFLAIAYSAPPLRFKTTPLLDSVSNGLYILPGVTTYAALTGVLPPLPVVAAGWLWAMAMHTFSAIPDITPDREAGIRTTATVLGSDGALAYCGLVWLAAAAIAATASTGLGALMAVYPVLVVGYWLRDADIGTVYWYYPFINAVTGMVITLGGLVALV